MVGGQHHTLAALPLGMVPGAYCTGGSVDSMTSPGEFGNLTHNWIRSPDRPIPIYLEKNMREN